MTKQDIEWYIFIILGSLIDLFLTGELINYRNAVRVTPVDGTFIQIDSNSNVTFRKLLCLKFLKSHRA